MVLSVPTGIGSKILSALLPTFVKRVVFLATLFCSVEAMRGVVAPRLQALNEELKLVSNTELLRGCAEFTDRVWKSCPIQEGSGLAASCAATVEQMPSWLRYDAPDRMASDVARLMMCRVT